MQVGVHRGLQQKSEALLLALTRQQSVGSALAALLNTHVSEALLESLQAEVTRAKAAPMAQVTSQPVVLQNPVSQASLKKCGGPQYVAHVMPSGVLTTKASSRSLKVQMATICL